MDALLPVNWYLDPDLLELEVRTLFRDGPGYIGHELTIPNVGDRRPVDLDGKQLILVRNMSGPEVLVNACRHRQAVLVDAPSSGRTIQCPLHKWTYGLDGLLLAAPRFPSNPCRSLFKIPSRSWNGLVLTGPANVESSATFIDPTGYRFHSSVELNSMQNWKTFVEVYLDLYHVPTFHPGFASLVDCNSLKWSLDGSWIVQTVGAKSWDKPAATPAWERWREKVREAFPRRPAHGAVWMFHFPNLMLEWNPGSIIVSSIRPVAPGHTVNKVEFFYSAYIMNHDPGFAEAHQAAYFETADEDERLGIMMDKGRRGLHAASRSDQGPLHHGLESEILRFHEYVLKGTDKL